MIKILFVCHGNICRSPMAEFIMKGLVEKAGRSAEFSIASAATSTEELGMPVYPAAKKELARHGINCSGKVARQLTRADYDKYDMLIGMDRANRINMQRICGGDPDSKISLILDHTNHPGEVSDPWYSGDFSTAWSDIYAGCTALLNKF